jgi:hypothetical protein
MFRFTSLFLLAVVIGSHAQANTSSTSTISPEAELTRLPRGASQSQSNPALEARPSSSSLLQLRDEYVVLPKRSYLVSFGVDLMNYQPQGQVQALGSTYEMSAAGSQPLPLLSWGALVDFKNGFKAGASGQAGYLSQGLTVNLPSGQETSARLNTTELRLISEAQYKLSVDSSWGARLGYGLGQRNITQTSRDSAARWSESVQYQTILAGLLYEVRPQVVVQAQYGVQSALNESPIELSSSEIGAGVRLVW